ncbi:MAG: glutamate--cysteine ligase [Opitutaceae bacterium]|nr:glutamate--cysteine ligase [Opitutaceae bacterium]
MSRPLHLFDAAGLELEYMVVRRDTGAVSPTVDRLMHARTGRFASDCRLGRCEASNELAAHVFELKVPRPARDFIAAERAFADAVARANRLLARDGTELLSGPMHPTMDPRHESTTWAHEGREIYEEFDRIFDCRGHGWFNLQSCHINLPFHGDDEFARLHAAVILLLPWLPALAAGSPFREGRVTGWRDTRLDTYRRNQERFPAIAGPIVPEPVFSEQEYHETIFAPMMRQVARVNRSGILEAEWLNSRGAIARFSRGAIEIRVLDVQECPRADMAIAALVFATLRELVARHGSRLPDLARRVATRARRAQLLACARHGLDAPLRLGDGREVFCLPARATTARALWRHVLTRLVPADALADSHREVITTILDRGTLADRLLAARGRSRSFAPVLRGLADCLAENRLFTSRVAGSPANRTG